MEPRGKLAAVALVRRTWDRRGELGARTAKVASYFALETVYRLVSAAELRTH
jgi:hypothetical protein